jgi:hypothetical protein
MGEPRFNTNLWTDFELGGWKAKGWIENAGPSGVFIRTSTIPDRGDKVWLSFEGPSGEKVEASGVVWWTTLDPGASCSTRQGFGVRLVASSQDYRRLLKKLSRQHA